MLASAQLCSLSIARYTPPAAAHCSLFVLAAADKIVAKTLPNCIPLTNLLTPIVFNHLEEFRDVVNLGGGRGLVPVGMLNH